MISDDQEAQDRASLELARLLDRELNAPDQEAQDFELALRAAAEEREQDTIRQAEEAALLDQYLKESGEDSEVTALLYLTTCTSKSHSPARHPQTCTSFNAIFKAHASST